MAERNGDTPEKRWFSQGQRVRVRGQVGVVMSSFSDGLHFVYIEQTRRIIAAPGTAIEPLEDQAPEATGDPAP